MESETPWLPPAPAPVTAPPKPKMRLRRKVVIGFVVLAGLSIAGTALRTAGSGSKQDETWSKAGASDMLTLSVNIATVKALADYDPEQARQDCVDLDAAGRLVEYSAPHNDGGAEARVAAGLLSQAAEACVNDNLDGGLALIDKAMPHMRAANGSVPEAVSLDALDG